MGTSSRRWTYDAVARATPGAAEPASAVRAYVAQADGVAAASGIDVDGRVRAFFASAILPAV